MPIRELSDKDEVLPIRELKADEQILPLDSAPQSNAAPVSLNATIRERVRRGDPNLAPIGQAKSPSFLKSAAGFSLPVAGSIGGTALGTAFPILGPATPAVGESLGSGLGEGLAQATGLSEPSKAAIAMAMAAGPLGRSVKPLWQGAKEMGVKLFAGRDAVAEAAESLLKKWLNPAVPAQALYDAAAGTKAMIPYGETNRVVSDILQKEVGRLPLSTQKEIIDVLQPIEKYIQPKNIPAKAAVKGPSSVLDAQGNPIMKVVQAAQPAKSIPGHTAPVADAMAEVRRLRLESSRAYDAKNSDLGNAINKVRSALLDDLERSGVPEVRQASKAYRKEMAIDNLAREIAKPTPGTKIADYARKDPLFKGAFSQAEMEQINRLARKLSYVVPSGSSGLMGRIGTTLGGEVLGGPGGAIAGFLGPELIHNLIATPYGRGVTERILAGSLKPGPKEAAILASVARSLGGQLLQSRGDSGDNPVQN